MTWSDRFFDTQPMMALFRSQDEATPGDGLLHPVVIVAIAVLVLNDHWWKEAFGTWWTGKLSDVAGMIFFPLFLQALWELGRAVAGRPFRPSRTALVWAAIATAVVFSLINVWTPASDVYRYGLGALSWPLHGLWAVVTGSSIPGYAPVTMTMDPTDLLAAPLVVVAIALGWRRCTPGGRGDGGRRR